MTWMDNEDYYQNSFGMDFVQSEQQQEERIG